MMEKYGVSYNDTPPTDEQIREVKRICLAKGLDVQCQELLKKTSLEVIELIEKLSQED